MLDTKRNFIPQISFENFPLWQIFIVLHHLRTESNVGTGINVKCRLILSVTYVRWYCPLRISVTAVRYWYPFLLSSYNQTLLPYHRGLRQNSTMSHLISPSSSCHVTARHTSTQIWGILSFILRGRLFKFYRSFCEKVFFIWTEKEQLRNRRYFVENKAEYWIVNLLVAEIPTNF